MKFTRSWLNDHLDSDADAATIAETLTQIGLEVEALDNPAERLEGFVIARVISAKPHPNADKLQLLEVDAGDGTIHQVVCGAPNARAGLIGVFAPTGTYIPGLDIVLKSAKIRDVESHGMMCSAMELCLGDEHDGIIELPNDAPLGAAYATWAGLDDPVFDIAITPNRQDCMGVRGIARDLAAAGLGQLRPLDSPEISSTEPCPVPISITDHEGCPAFFGRAVQGVTNRASPAWMQRRLRAIGQRPISALVDVTNYINIDHGRPLHVYDADRLQGGLVARRARHGETVDALNDTCYTLDESMTVIADDAGPQGIAGVMGGAATAVSETTRNVVIECAFFSPERTGATGRKLGLHSESRMRFERGVDPGFVAQGLDLATRMILDFCGGTPSQPIHAGTPPTTPRQLAFRSARTRSLAGLDLPPDLQADKLERLGFILDRTHETQWQVTIPTWRRDIDGEADLVEEIVRLAGIDTIPATPLPRPEGVATATATPLQHLEKRLRRVAAARGLNEAMTWSFISTKEAALFGGGHWTLENPISSDLCVMRPCLLPGLLSAAQRNLDRGQTVIRLFELGRSYSSDHERPGLAFLLAGARAARHWRCPKPGSPDFFDAKGEIYALVEHAGLDPAKLRLETPASPWLHPGRSARILLGNKILGEFGEIHPRTAKAFGIRAAIAVGEIYLDAFPLPRDGKKKRTRAAYAPPALQAVTRDFAFVAPQDSQAGEILRAARNADKKHIVHAEIFDDFMLGDAERSLGISVDFQPGERSFTDKELDALSTKVIAAATKFGARLRG